MEYTEYIPEQEQAAAEAAALLQQEQKTRVAIDSLPYIDAYDDAAQSAAQLLIQQEMRTFPQTHTVSPVTVSFTSPTIEADWERVEKANGVGWSKPLTFPEPEVPDASASLTEWEAAVEQAKIQYEYAKNRLELLELQNQFGANSWLAFNKTFEGIRDHFRTMLQGYKTKIEQINIQRKTQQLQVKAKLVNTNAAFLETTQRSAEIEKACEALEAELKT